MTEEDKKKRLSTYVPVCPSQTAGKYLGWLKDLYTGTKSAPLCLVSAGSQVAYLLIYVDDIHSLLLSVLPYLQLIISL
ncbi:hypothetical protein Tco_1229658 [Tanacetum coccineum]